MCTLAWVTDSKILPVHVHVLDASRRTTALYGAELAEHDMITGTLKRQWLMMFNGL
jgi:hypothetical protein